MITTSGTRRALVLVVALGCALAACGGGSDATGDGDADDGAGRDHAAGLVAALADQEPATAPFGGLGAIEVTVGDQLLRVVVADDPAERRDGLRGRTVPEPYDGMLFVHASDSTSSFTMRGVDDPLDLAFYDADGERLGGHDLEPCPQLLDCPTYPPPAPWRYALETPPGELPAGPLRAAP